MHLLFIRMPHVHLKDEIRVPFFIFEFLVKIIFFNILIFLDNFKNAFIKNTL